MKTYAIIHDAIELDTLYKAIDKEELEKKIAQCYCDYFYFRKELEVGIKFNPAPEEYWATKQNVLFEQYGIMWHSPAELNTQTLGKEYCEYMPEVWIPSEIVSLRKPADSTLLLPWTHIEVELCHTIHDFTMTNRTYSGSKLIPKENVREGSNLISFFDSFYDSWGNINIDHVDKYSISGRYQMGDFTATRKKGFWSKEYGIAGYTSGSIVIQLMAEKEPALPLGSDKRKLVVASYKRVAIDAFEPVELLTFPLDGMSENYIPYEVGDEYTDAVLKRIVCMSRNSAGISGQIELMNGDIRNFLLGTGEYYRYLFPDAYVKVSLVDDNMEKATVPADAACCRYYMRTIPAETDENTVRVLAKGCGERVDTDDIMTI